MVQAIVGLFMSYGDNNISDKIDVVIRTTMASIFGYFVSSNFVKNDICDSGLDPNSFESKHFKEEQKKLNKKHDLQIKIVGSVCVISMFFLFIIRYFAYADNDSLAYVFLFRDFVCTSIGFLIGMPSDQNNVK